MIVSATNSWPDTLSYVTFLKKVKVSNNALYRALYLQFVDEFSVKNQRIAVEKLSLIFKATFRLANAQGFQAMTLRQLAKETKLSMGGLYAYIHSKDHLADLIYAFLNFFCSESFVKLEQQNQHPEDKLKTIIFSHIYLSEFMQPWFYFAYMESKNLSRLHKKNAIEAELSTEIKISNIISLGIKESVFKNIDATLFAALIKAMMQDWYLKRWKYQRRNISVDTFALQVMQVVHDHLAVREKTA